MERSPFTAPSHGSQAIAFRPEGAANWQFAAARRLSPVEGLLACSEKRRRYWLATPYFGVPNATPLFAREELLCSVEQRNDTAPGDGDSREL